jgi:hypothetical protein
MLETDGRSTTNISNPSIKKMEGDESPNKKDHVTPYELKEEK